MQSQLDCMDSPLPGTGVFDIKARAAVPIRLDILNHEVCRTSRVPLYIRVSGVGSPFTGYLIKRLT
ncbi:hypothetical protein BKA83DRAFT_4260767 [Pisolithus microcarpus]|nr:hypothetical protein BKA83DRAFT_4260767 [Pisolithus microcarpus]